VSSGSLIQSSMQFVLTAIAQGAAAIMLLMAEQ
jgi:hypothetical protein